MNALFLKHQPRQLDVLNPIDLFHNDELYRNSMDFFEHPKEELNDQYDIYLIQKQLNLDRQDSKQLHYIASHVLELKKKILEIQ